MTSGSLPTQVQCPSCRATFPVQLERIVDVGLDPAAKGRMLRGQINIARCPQCGSQGMLSGPLLYHDPAHDMLLVYVPLELNLDQTQREQLIGSLTRELMASIPAEARKGYLFSPQTVMTLDSMIDRILQADGVSAEILDRQRKRSELLTRLMGATEAEVQSIVKAHDDEIDELLFVLLSSQLDAARTSGNGNRAAALVDLRNRLLSLSTWSQERGVTPDVLDAQQARLDMIEEFLSADESDWPSLAQQNDSKLDYTFFELLTAVAEQVDEESASRLLRLRSRLLELSSTGRAARVGLDAIEDMRRAVTDAGGLSREMLLDKLVAATDAAALEAVAVAGSSALDYSFFLILADRIDAAEKQNDRAQVARLQALREKLLELTSGWEQARTARVDHIRRELDALMEASDSEAAVRDVLPEVDELFLSVLAGRSEEARSAGKDEVADKLEGLLHRIISEIRAAAPPGIRLVNELIEQEDAADVRRMLTERREELTPEVVQMIQRLKDDLRSSGDTELAKRVARILELVADPSELEQAT